MHEKVTLPNGVRIVYDYFNSVRSASVGFWMGHGSRYEPSELGGISHAIEHMVFKGTQSRTSTQIAEEMDAIGGQVNAFTTKETTCFYARALDSHLDKAIDLLSDIFFHPKMDEGDWETERGVILEEIGMYEDSPEDLVVEQLFEKIFPTSALGRPILGTPETLGNMTAKTILDYKNKAYSPRSLVVSLAGNFTDDHRKFLEKQLLAETPAPPQSFGVGNYKPAFTAKEKPIEQNHLCIGFPSIRLSDSRKYILGVLSNILGSGMSSRLFQKVREELGLCYSIYTFNAQHLDCGVTSVYVATGKQTEEKAITTSLDVIKEFTKNGPCDDEINRAREQQKASVLMGLESTSSRMSLCGQNELLTGKIPTPDFVVEQLDKANKENVTELAREIFNLENLSFSAVGQVRDVEKYRDLL